FPIINEINEKALFWNTFPGFTLDKKDLKFLNPVSGRDFIGYRSEITLFRDILRDFKSGKSTINGLLISGAPGLGKTSLMKVFKETAETERAKTVQLEPKIGRKGTFILKELFSETESLTEEVKKGRFARKKTDLEIPPVHLDEGYDAAIEALFASFEDRTFPEPVIVFIDNVDRLSNSGYDIVTKALIELMKKLVQEKLQLFLVLSALDQTWDDLGAIIQDITTVKLDRFDISYSEILLRRSKVSSLLNPDYRKLIIDNVDRTPFILKFAIDVTEWAENELKKAKKEELGEEEYFEDLDIQEVQKTAHPFIQNTDISQFLKEVFQISQDEEKLLTQIIDTQVNILNHKEVEVDPIVMKSLVDKGLLVQQDEYIQIVSYGLAEKLGIQSLLASTSIESEFLLNVIESDIRIGLKPSKSMLDQLTGASNPQGEIDANAMALGGRSRQIFKAAFERNLMHDASRLANITGGFLKLAGDEEGAGNFLEEAAKMFKDRGKLHYAKELYRKAVEIYTADWKIKSCAREAAMIYVNLAEEAQKADQTGLIRAFLWNAYIMYEKAGEIEGIKEVLNRVQETYDSMDIGSIFFKNLKPEDEEFIEE
ncbi:MAG: AAA family ATPase, partial [Candidatus Hodarchaeota archaeon]